MADLSGFVSALCDIPTITEPARLRQDGEIVTMPGGLDIDRLFKSRGID